MYVSQDAVVGVVPVSWVDNPTMGNTIHTWRAPLLAQLGLGITTPGERRIIVFFVTRSDI